MQMQTVKHKLKEQAGYSMVEVLVAILLLSIAILPMVSMFDAGLNASRTSGDYDKARALANSYLEEVKANPSSYPPSGSPHDCEAETADSRQPSNMSNCDVITESVQLITTDSGSARFDENDDGSMIRVTVTVEWNGGEYETTGVASP